MWAIDTIKEKSKQFLSKYTQLVYLCITIIGCLLGGFRLFYLPSEPGGIATDTYYGKEYNTIFRHKDNTEIEPYQISVPPGLISNLQEMLRQPTTEQLAIFQRIHIRPLVLYWRGKYLIDWNKRLNDLNRYKQFKTQINGLNIHFIHEKSIDISENKHVIPILFLHGWPGSIREFYDLIPKFMKYSKKNNLKFNVVIPSLVGHGFSSMNSTSEFGTYEMSIVMRNLMIRLGYNRFMIHGGIWGSIIGSNMVAMFPENVMAFHTNLCFIEKPAIRVKAILKSIVPNSYHANSNGCLHFVCGRELLYLLTETGHIGFLAYLDLHRVAMPLTKDPIRLVEYFVEKITKGTDFGNEFLKDDMIEHYEEYKTEILDNIMIYYMTNTVLSSMQYYVNSISEKQINISYYNRETHIPMGCIQFKNNLPILKESQEKENYTRFMHKTTVNRSVHYPGIEAPDLLFKDIIRFVQKILFLKNIFKPKQKLNN